jgi:hypothetical protein
MMLKISGSDQRTAEEQQQILQYLLKDRALKEVPDFIRGDVVLRTQLALGKELINTLFPLVLTKNSNEHFGLSKRDYSCKAIPYIRNNTPGEGTTFAEIKSKLSNPPADRTLRDDFQHLKRLRLIEISGHGRGAKWHLMETAGHKAE